jgi:hypothetical protein
MTRFVCLGLLVGLAFTSGVAQAQDVEVEHAKGERSAKNSLYIELGGNAALYSLNYERFLVSDLSARVGVMYMSVSASSGSGSQTTRANASWFGAPIMLSYLGIGSENHKLDLGLGVVLMNLSAGASTFNATANASGLLVAGTATLGYRYAPVDGGVNFKAGFTPLFIQSAGQTYFLPWFGIAIGYGF